MTKHSRQGKAILAEAEKCGAALVASNLITTDRTGSASAIVGTGLKALAGFGQLLPDRVETFLFETNGARHLYVQPMAGNTPLPGEHHAWVRGGLRSPVALVKPGRSAKWESPHDEDLAAWLHTIPHLSSVAKGTKFSWAIGTGEIEFPWAVQVASLGDGRSQLVMQAGRYGGVTSVKVGFAHFLALAGAVSTVVTQGMFPQQYPLVEPSYSDFFWELILGADPSPASVDSNATEAKLNHATNLMTSRQLGPAVNAFTAIAEQHPEKRAHCFNNIGACHYLRNDFQLAIRWYQAALEAGAPPQMIQENLAEAEQALQRVD